MNKVIEDDVTPVQCKSALTESKSRNKEKVRKLACKQITTARVYETK